MYRRSHTTNGGRVWSWQASLACAAISRLLGRAVRRGGLWVGSLLCCRNGSVAIGK